MHWIFHPSSANALRRMWLPPYQFERARHWLPYIDRATEVLKQRPETDIGKRESQSTNPPAKLITLSDTKDKFIIHTACQYMRL